MVRNYESAAKIVAPLSYKFNDDRVAKAEDLVASGISLDSLKKALDALKADPRVEKFKKDIPDVINNMIAWSILEELKK